MTGRAYIESLDNFLVNLDLNNLEWLPKFKGSTIFPQLFDATNLSDITTLTKDSSKFPVENFDVSTSVTIKCSVMAYKFTTQEKTLMEGYSVNLLAVHFLNSLSQNTSQLSIPKK